MSLLAYTLPFIDMNMDEVTALFDINLFGVMRMVQEFIRLLIASGNGRIVNIGKCSERVLHQCQLLNPLHFCRKHLWNHANTLWSAICGNQSRTPRIWKHVKSRVSSVQVCFVCVQLHVSLTLTFLSVKVTTVRRLRSFIRPTNDRGCARQR